MLRIFKYTGIYKKYTISALLVLIVSVLFSVIPYFFVYRLLDLILNHKTISFGFAVQQILLLGVSVLIHMVLYSVGLMLSHKGAYGTLKNLRVSLQARMEKLPLGVIQDIGNGQIKKMFTDDIDSIELLLAHQIPEGISNLIVTMVLLISLAVIDWRLFLLCILALVIASVAMAVMGRIGFSGMNNYYAAAARMNNTIIEYVNGMEVMKIFNRDGDSYKKYRNDVLCYRDYTLAWYKACWPWMAVYFSILPCLSVFALPAGVFFSTAGKLPLTQLAIFLCISYAISTPLLKVSTQFSSFPQVGYKVDALEKLLEADPLRATDDAFAGISHDITYEHVTFGYKDKTVIHDVSIQIKENSVTAFVGESGSGKSTLAKLLVHFYDVNSGRILVGGQDIVNMSIESLNEQISYVSQEQYLFNTSIYDNIKLGKPEATREEVLRAAERAQCMDFIQRFPNGIDTSVGDGGKALSGGERQRTAFARAILKDAPIVVLDEATAFIDPENEEKMNMAIAEVVKDKTLIVIAHRLKSIMHADLICVLKDGHIVAQGKHDELLAGCTDYKVLWERSEESSEWQIQNQVQEGLDL